MKRLIVAITGASGAIYGVRTLQLLRAAGGVEVHLVISPSAARTLLAETDYTMDDVRKRIINEGAEPEPTTPEQHAALIDREETKWSAVIRAAGIQPQ